MIKSKKYKLNQVLHLKKKTLDTLKKHENEHPI